jgi:hypothetical protein
MKFALTHAVQKMHMKPLQTLCETPFSDMNTNNPIRNTQPTTPHRTAGDWLKGLVRSNQHRSLPVYAKKATRLDGP